MIHALVQGHGLCCGLMSLFMSWLNVMVQCHDLMSWFHVMADVVAYVMVQYCI